MKKNPTTNKPQIQNRFTKRTIAIIFCLATLVLFATACYTTQKCPAYGYTSQVEEIKNNE
jgi:hypothetical protein